MKNGKTILKIIIVFTLSILFGCKENSTDSTPNKLEQIYPLAINNTWVYSTIVYDSVGIIINTHTDTMVIKRDTVINNEKWYSYNSLWPGYANREDGFYSYFEFPTLEYKYPAKVGDTTVVTKYLTRKVLSTNQSISVNNIVYSAYEYYDSYSTTPTTWISYLVPNIGPVRQDYFWVNSKSQKYLRARTDLIYYKLY